MKNNLFVLFLLLSLNLLAQKTSTSILDVHSVTKASRPMPEAMKAPLREYENTTFQSFSWYNGGGWLVPKDTVPVTSSSSGFTAIRFYDDAHKRVWQDTVPWSRENLAMQDSALVTVLMWSGNDPWWDGGLVQTNLKLIQEFSKESLRLAAPLFYPLYPENFTLFRSWKGTMVNYAYFYENKRVKPQYVLHILEIKLYGK